MRKIFIVPLVLLLAITSCKKDNTTTSVTATITADIDGVTTTFNTDAIAIKTNLSGTYAIAIAGYQGTALTSSQISIGIGGTDAVTTGAYDDVPSAAPDEVSLVYTQQPGSGVYGAIGSGSDTAKVTITSISSTQIQGTFSGGVVLTSGSTSPSSHIITNGRFTVTFNTSNGNNNNNSTGTITGKVDGTSVTFNTDATAIETTSGGYMIAIGGYEGGAGSSTGIALSISSNSAFTSGTVFSYSNTNGNLPQITYTQQPGTVEYTDLTVQQTTVTLTSVSSSNVQGTFSGTVDILSSGSPSSHVITNGTFNVPLTHL